MSNRVVWRGSGALASHVQCNRHEKLSVCPSSFSLWRWKMATMLEGNTQLNVGVNGLPPESVIFGRSPAMLEVRRKLVRLASANLPVLVQGESGTGKEIIAQLIHRLSPWADGPLVKINCPAIPGTLLESELFGSLQHCCHHPSHVQCNRCEKLCLMPKFF